MLRGITTIDKFSEFDGRFAARSYSPRCENLASVSATWKSLLRLIGTELVYNGQQSASVCGAWSVCLSWNAGLLVSTSSHTSNVMYPWWTLLCIHSTRRTVALLWSGLVEQLAVRPSRNLGVTRCRSSTVQQTQQNLSFPGVIKSAAAVWPRLLWFYQSVKRR